MMKAYAQQQITAPRKSVDEAQYIVHITNAAFTLLIQ